mgnify:CR=1 FL=1
MDAAFLILVRAYATIFCGGRDCVSEPFLI